MDKRCAVDIGDEQFRDLRQNNGVSGPPSPDYKALYACTMSQTTSEPLPDGARWTVDIGRNHATGEYHVVWCQEHDKPATRRFDGTCGADGQFDTLVRAD